MKRTPERKRRKVQKQTPWPKPAPIADPVCCEICGIPDSERDVVGRTPSGLYICARCGRLAPMVLNLRAEIAALRLDLAAVRAC